MDDQHNIEEKGVRNINLTSEMRKSFLEYAMSVIISRALPDARDGLKPVQRRIIYGMNELGCYSDKPFKKSARIVGDVMGKYHPHGDSSIYEALVRMAQDFSYRYMLVDGHGNFGSIDGDGAAAMRYTESRMSKICMEMVRDINKDTIDFVPNYDGEEKEPSVLPSRIPNLLINGTTGIAVGMATNMAPHNLGEVVDGLLAYSKNRDMSVAELMEYIKGPDFPTGAYILGKSAIKKAFETGQGLIVMRARSEIEDIGSNKKAIIVTEIPYMVNKARLIEKIAEHVKNKNIDGITELRDESSREGIRIVIELRRDVQPEVILNQLYKLTSLQTTFGVNNTAIVNDEPKTLTLKDMLDIYLNHQEDVIRRRTAYDLKKAEDRAHILEGLKRAIDNIDAIIALIRSSRTTEIIQQRLMDEFNMSDRQAKAIREMQLQRLAGLEREKIENELKALLELIADLKDILANEERVLEIIRDELTEIKNKYGDKRRTEIIQGTFDIEDEDLIPEEDVIISMTTNGYVKRMPVDTYKAQNRGGKGVKGMATNNDDVVKDIINMSTHDDLLVFTNFGKVYRMKGYNIPEFGRTAKGLPIVNLLNMDKNENVKTMISIHRDEVSEKCFLFFVTKNGIVKRTKITEFENIRTSGKIAISLRDDDELVDVKLTNGESEILLAASNGKAIRFDENDVREMGRTASGVRGMNVDGAHIVGVTTSLEGSKVLVVTEYGYGKISPADEYRLAHRGGKGVKTLNVTSKNGDLVAIKAVEGNEDLMIMTSEGIVIRLPMEQVKEAGRATQGVRLIRVNGGSVVSSISVVDKTDESEETAQTNETEESQG
ncbi:DNA gyrase subunit A [Sharpea azabuensis]|uniref:DNA gyrase subunit A n=1 Tax=Sharpea azabuensis TaxID=322505 RepID=UPI0008E9FA16|nr:DNA gyrase subunit A [Sharpea azabuensis]SFD61635.1 DNA gyrase subunit A [Sharpea azabuensis]SFK60418.1 DNA gyrase subunit A [Sharpea azabuensis]